jgi:hypothetical protein
MRHEEMPALAMRDESIPKDCEVGMMREGKKKTDRKFPHGRSIRHAMSRNPTVEKAELAPLSFPSFIPSVIATAILSLALGYWVGVGNSFFSAPPKRSRNKQKKRYQSSDDGGSSSNVSSGDETDSSGTQTLGLSHPNEECKMVVLSLDIVNCRCWSFGGTWEWVQAKP